jgi:hypothetical protein
MEVKPVPADEVIASEGEILLPISIRKLDRLETTRQSSNASG